MTTAADNLQKALEELVASKTMSLEGIEYVNRIKAQAAALADANAKLTNERNLARTQFEAIAAENHKLRKAVEQIDAREKALQVREEKVTHLEREKAVAEAQSGTFRECFGLVFRNLEVREKAFGRVPAIASVQPQPPSQYNSNPPPGFVPGNGDGTVTVDKTDTKTVG